MTERQAATTITGGATQIVAFEPTERDVCCRLANGEQATVSRFLHQYLRLGDTIRVAGSPVSEFHVARDKNTWPRHLYFGAIGYVTVPKLDRRAEPYLRAEVPDGALGVRAVHLPATAVRDHFFRADRRRKWGEGLSLYDVLGVSGDASAGDLRVAFRVRSLEAATPADARIVERCFNVLMTPELRTCYGNLLRDSEAPPVFPNSGFGRLLVAGDLGSDGQTFFARQILSFAPSLSKLRLSVPFRRLAFLPDRASYRDSRRRCEVVLDPVLLGIDWDQTWNTWKHLVPGRIEVNASFVETGQYRCRSGQWELSTSSTALPSRLEVSAPAEIADQIQAAKDTYHRFGQHWDAITRVRKQLEKQPLSESDLSALCSERGVPPTFDVAQINWRPDYDPYFYTNLRKLARTMFLFQDEYIFECEHLLVVERPQIGHATYLFAKPTDLRTFAGVYARTSKRAIRENREGIAERLKFVGRVMHGKLPSHWLRQVRSRLGEGTTP